MYGDFLYLCHWVQKCIINPTCVSNSKSFYRLSSGSTRISKSMEHRTLISSPLVLSRSFQKELAGSTWSNTSHKTWQAFEMTTTQSWSQLRPYSLNLTKAEQRSRSSSPMVPLHRSQMVHSSINSSKRNYFTTRQSLSWMTFLVRITQRQTWLTSPNVSASSASRPWRTQWYFPVGIFVCARVVVR